MTEPEALYDPEDRLTPKVLGQAPRSLAEALVQVRFARLRMLLRQPVTAHWVTLYLRALDGERLPPSFRIADDPLFCELIQYATEPRDVEALRLRLAGWSFQEIGTRLGVTARNARQRVAALQGRCGKVQRLPRRRYDGTYRCLKCRRYLPPEAFWKHRERRYQSWCRECLSQHRRQVIVQYVESAARTA